MLTVNIKKESSIMTAQTIRGIADTLSAFAEYHLELANIFASLTKEANQVATALLTTPKKEEKPISKIDTPETSQKSGSFIDMDFINNSSTPSDPNSSTATSESKPQNNDLLFDLNFETTTPSNPSVSNTDANNNDPIFDPFSSFPSQPQQSPQTNVGTNDFFSMSSPSLSSTLFDDFVTTEAKVTLFLFLFYLDFYTSYTFISIHNRVE